METTLTMPRERDLHHRSPISNRHSARNVRPRPLTPGTVSACPSHVLVTTEEQTAEDETLAPARVSLGVGECEG
jgi:hypothetical protein